MKSLIIILCYVHYVALPSFAYCLGGMVKVGGICYDPNDGNNYCLTIVECADQSSHGGCINSRCNCVSGYKWVLSDLKCQALNTNTKSCSSLSDCYDKTPNVAICNTMCTCIPPSNWDSSLLMCTVPNNGQYACTSINVCQEQNPFIAGCVNGFCICKTPYIWTGISCLIPNDEQYQCSHNNDCADRSEEHTSELQ